MKTSIFQISFFNSKKKLYVGFQPITFQMSIWMTNLFSCAYDCRIRSDWTMSDPTNTDLFTNVHKFKKISELLFLYVFALENSKIV